VTCRSCSAEISDKAIVCYRCGAPTAVEAAAGRAAPRPGRGRLIALVIVLAVLVALLVFTYIRRAA